MTDYYIEGPGHTAYGPYTLENARKAAKLLAHDMDHNRSIQIFATVETAYSRIYDDELPEKPEDDDVYTPWRD